VTGQNTGDIFMSNPSLQSATNNGNEQCWRTSALSTVVWCTVWPRAKTQHYTANFFCWLVGHLTQSTYVPNVKCLHRPVPIPPQVSLSLDRRPTCHSPPTYQVMPNVARRVVHKHSPLSPVLHGAYTMSRKEPVFRITWDEAKL